jgi:hypothetical protein
MGLLDKMKAGAEQAVSSGQRQAQILQTKRELSQAYSELGKKVYGLVERGEITHSELAAGVDHITELQSRLAGEGDAAAADDAGGAPTATSGPTDAEEADIVE